MAILNPKPLRWKPPDFYWFDRLSTRGRESIPCRFSKRHTLWCAVTQDKRMSVCKDCYMFQQGIGENYFSLHPEERVVHVCDRCGREIPNVDSATYIEVLDRNGRLRMGQELCWDCAVALTDWAKQYRDEEEE